ncbi:MAG: glycosyltransferase family 4 protein, partial [Thermodesulfobacteriota bacterium]
MGKGMKIGFLLGSPDINGGTYVIYEHGSRLAEMGHRVAVITEQFVDPERHGWHPGAKNLEWLTLEEAENHTFDIVLATWWQSPFLLPRLSARNYVYFVQSIESRFFEDEEPTHHSRRDLGIWQQYCDSTYSLNIPMITEAQWIQKHLYDNYNSNAFLVRNGIRKDIYTTDGHCAAPRVAGKLRVLVEGPVDVHYKNVPKSIRLCREAGVDEVWLLTSSDVESYPEVDRVFSRIPIHETPEIYRSCDVLVKLSYVEGMFGPPLEMFHCGGTAIVYDVTGHDEYITHDENSYVVARDQDQEVVSLLQRLKVDSFELKRLKEGADHTAENWPNWDNAAADFEVALAKISSGPPTSRSYLRKLTDQLTEANNERLQMREVNRFQSREQELGTHKIDQGNFLQVYYWAEKDGLSGENFKWLYYGNDELVSLTVDLTITGFPFWIRVDPSTRMGMVAIESISVVNKRLGNVV